MSSKTLLTLAGIACLLLVRVAAFRLSMNPDHVQVSTAPQSITFSCTADVDLTGCQFRWWDFFTDSAGPLMDLSWGSQSLVNSSHLTTGLTGYSYSGRGLGEGDCRVSLQVKGRKIYMIACRVRAESGGWTYAWTDLYAHIWESLLHTPTLRELVVLPGGEARFEWKAQEPLGGCRFFLPGLYLHYKDGAQSEDSKGRHRYVGAGLEGGECSLVLTNVSDADNGPVCRWTSFVQNKDDYTYMTLIVARPPSAPTLSVVYTAYGVTATCVVPEARPVANISWFLANDVVRQDSLNDFRSNPQDEWRWPWMQGSVQQRVTLRLQAQDSGKVLKCVVSHVALARPLEATEIISFTESARETAPLAAPGITPVAAPNTTRGPGTTLDPACTAASMLGLLCQEYRGLENTSCPRDEVNEFRVRAAGATARTAELAEEQAKVTLEAAKAQAAASAALASVTLEAVKAQAAASAALANVTLEAAKAQAAASAALASVTLEAAKETAVNAPLANLAEEQAKFTLGAAKSNAKAEEETKATLAKVALETEEAKEKTKATFAKVALEAEEAEEETEATLANVT